MLQHLKVDLKPKLRSVEIISYKGISGNMPFLGAILDAAGRKQNRSFRGKGLEFEKFREFAPGDDAGMIDWKATLRANKTLVKVYTEEQNKDVVIMVDVSSSMIYGSINKLKCEYAAELAASLAYGLSGSGDNVGFCMFNDHLVKHILPAAGMSQYYKIIIELKNTKNYDGKFDIIKPLEQLSARLGRRAIVIIISDFIGLEPGWENHYKTFSSRFEVIGICVRDPADDLMPIQEENITISHPYTDKELLIDTEKLAKDYENDNKRRMEEINIIFKKQYDRFMVLHTDKSFKKQIEMFFAESSWIPT